MTDAEVIADYLAAGHITKKYAEILYHYFLKCDRVASRVAEKMECSAASIQKAMLKMHDYGVLARDSSQHGKYTLNEVIKPETKKSIVDEILPYVRDMADDERLWMIKNYKEKYSKNRGEAARLLGVDRYTINVWAMRLGIDQPSSSEVVLGEEVGKPHTKPKPEPKPSKPKPKPKKPKRKKPLKNPRKGSGHGGRFDSDM